MSAGYPSQKLPLWANFSFLSSLEENFCAFSLWNLPLDLALKNRGDAWRIFKALHITGNKAPRRLLKARGYSEDLSVQIRDETSKNNKNLGGFLFCNFSDLWLNVRRSTMKTAEKLLRKEHLLQRFTVVIFFFPYNLHPPPHPDKPPRPSHPRGLDSGPFRLRSAPFGSVWLRFGSVPGPFRVRFGGVGWGRGGVGERGFCKGKEYH